MLASGMDSIGVCSHDWLSYTPADNLPARSLGVAYSEPERFFKVFLVIGGFFCPSSSFPEGGPTPKGTLRVGLGKNSLLHLSEWIPAPERGPFGAGSVSITLYKSTRLAPTVCRGQVG